jgi:hypothetical protein
MGVFTPGITSTAESYNGITWSTINSMITGRGQLGGSGTQNSALAFGGLPSSTATEMYNGGVWLSKSSINRGSASGGGAGNSFNAIIAGNLFAGTFTGPSETFNSLFQTFNYSSSSGSISIGNSILPSSLNITGSINVSGSGVINNLIAGFALTASYSNSALSVTSKTLTIVGTPTIQAADIITYPMWRIASPVTASLISVYSTGSLLYSGSQVNASKNSSLLLASPLILTGSTWISSSVLQNQYFNVGDILNFNFLSLTGSLTNIIVQIDFIVK